MSTNMTEYRDTLRVYKLLLYITKPTPNFVKTTISIIASDNTGHSV